MLTPFSSQLDNIANFNPFSPEKVAAFLARMQDAVIPRIIENENCQAVLVAEILNRPLFWCGLNS